MIKEHNLPCLEISKLTYFPDSKVNVLNNLSFELYKGKVTVILGSNGSGKTTLINLIAGFIRPNSGSIKINQNGNESFSSVVFQDPVLLDWKSSYDNIMVGLLSSSKNVGNQMVEKYIEMLQLDQHINKLPKQLSGGFKQRVAIARALVVNPQLLLLDEPFSALDVYSKEKLQEELYDIVCKENKSVILVTHDISEAIFFADNILILENGKIQDSFNVELPKPRKWTKLRNFPAFIKLREVLRKRLNVRRNENE